MMKVMKVRWKLDPHEESRVLVNEGIMFTNKQKTYRIRILTDYSCCRSSLYLIEVVMSSAKNLDTVGSSHNITVETRHDIIGMCHIRIFIGNQSHRENVCEH